MPAHVALRSVIPLLFPLLLWSCAKQNPKNQPPASESADSLALAEMIRSREKAMIRKDLSKVMDQFAEDASWINSQGYYFEGKEALSDFHRMLIRNDTADYHYLAGTPRIRILDKSNALAYYSWKMLWYTKKVPRDTFFREIGLMTLSAQKADGRWKWVAVTNQHTPWFYEEVAPVVIH